MKYNNDNYIKNNTEIRQSHEDGHSKNDHHKCGYSYFKRLVSYIMAFILTIITTCTALTVNPSTTVHVHAEEKKGYHKETLSKTYSIIRLDDDPYFSSATKLYRENSKSRFGWPTDVWCGTCNDSYNDCNHWFSQAAFYYGFYDDTVYGAWTITGVHMYGGEANRISSNCTNPLHSGGDDCNETHGQSAPSRDIYWNEGAVYKFTSAWEFNYFNNHIKVNGSAVPKLSLQNLVDDKGCSFSFSAENGLGGTITVNYPDAWVPNDYTITFNPNNGENTSTRTVTYDTGNCNAGAVSASRTGYTLQGWYTGTDGTGEMVYDASGNAVNGTCWSGTGSSAVWKGLSNVSLYAHWTADNSTVTLYFYKDGVRDDSKTKTYSVQNGTTFNAAEHAGDSSFDNCHYVSVDTASWNVTADSSTNVRYERNVLKVAYKGNGNDGGSTDGTTVKYGDTVTIAQNGFTRTGCSFTGWNTAADGSGTSYSAGSTFTSQPSGSENRLTLYAQWSPHVHTVTLNRGTGISAVSGGGSHYYGEDVTITSTTAAGYESPYWRQDIEGSGTAFGNSYTFKMPDDSISFTAYATAKTYTATFNSNGGTLIVDGVATNETARTVKYDAVDYWDISWISASRPGYRLGGWITGTGEKIWGENGHAVKGDYWSGNGNTALWKHDGCVTVYADWIDATPPTVGVFPAQTTDYAKSISITINAEDMAGSDAGQLAENNAYQYCVCTDADSPSGNWADYTNGSPFYIGGGLTGTYYLWVKPVKDAAGNESVSSPDAGCHRFGPYNFDNTAPDLSNVSGSYGWFGEGTVIGFDAADAHSGIGSMIIADFNGIVPADGEIATDRQYYFGSEGVSLYTLTVSDRLGNTAQKPFIVKIDKKGDIISDNAVWKGLGSLTVFAHWVPNTYTVQFERNDNDGGSTRAAGSMPDVSFTYDRDEKLPDNGYTREGYAFIEWNTSPDGTGSSYAGGETVRNLTIMPGGVIKLYAIWRDTSAPKIEVTPTCTVNPDANKDAVRNIDITITVAESGSGLTENNLYEYGISTNASTPPRSWQKYSGTADKNNFSVTLPELGLGLDGCYYLWVRQIKDMHGNNSTSSSAIKTIGSYHIYGMYTFDNTAPTGTVKYVENNTTLGLYNDDITTSPYAVMTIYNPYDNLSGIDSFTLVISDSSDASNSAEFTFTPDGDIYTCRFRLYDCLSGSENVERVSMQVIAKDRLGNTAALPITQYDFGTMQTGAPIKADDIGFTDISDKQFSPGSKMTSTVCKYLRDYFRIEAYIENISFNRLGTSFKGGHLGRLRIYTFGYVHSISADFGSIKNYYNPVYDIFPDLPSTVLSTRKKAYIYLHDFFIPLYCADSTYTDTFACGVKGGTAQNRNVLYSVNGIIIDELKTILKYGAD